MASLALADASGPNFSIRYDLRRQDTQARKAGRIHPAHLGELGLAPAFRVHRERRGFQLLTLLDAEFGVGSLKPLVDFGFALPHFELVDVIEFDRRLQVKRVSGPVVIFQGFGELLGWRSIEWQDMVIEPGR